MSTKAAKRYGAALFSLGVELGQSEAILTQLTALSALWEDCPELRFLIQSPGLKVADKARVFKTVYQRLALSEPLENLLGLLLDKGRLSILPDLANEYLSLVDRAAGRVRAHCLTAQPLTDPETQLLQEKLVAFSGAEEILLSVEVDESLLAGFVARVGGKVIDASLKGRLNRLGQSLAR